MNAVSSSHDAHAFRIDNKVGNVLKFTKGNTIVVCLSRDLLLDNRFVSHFIVYTSQCLFR